MRKLIYILTTLIVFAACESKIGLTQAQSNITKEQTDFTIEKLIVLQNPPKKTTKRTAANYNGLQLGRAVQRDVSKMFGKPLDEFQPFDEVESTDDEWTFYYENFNNFERAHFIFDKRSKILKEVWLRRDNRPLTIEKAIEIYGNDYFLRGTGENICSAKQSTKLEYPFTIVYPHKGIELYVREAGAVTDVFYTAECP